VGNRTSAKSVFFKWSLTCDTCVSMWYVIDAFFVLVFELTSTSLCHICAFARFLIVSFYVRQQNASHVFAVVWASVRPSVRLSVHLSVTLVICIKTVQARITKSLLWAALRSLVYRDKISSHWVQGFPSNDGVEEGYPPKKDVILPLLARIM